MRDVLATMKNCHRRGGATMAKADRVSRTFGQQVRAARERRGWTQAQLVAELKKCGEPMDQATVARLETGKRGVSVDDLLLFALALGVAPLYLLLPRATGPVELAPGMAVSGWEALAWARGMYALPFTDATDTEAAVDDPEVRHYYEAVPDYEERAIRHHPLVRTLWLEVGYAMTCAASTSTRAGLRRSLERTVATAEAALRHLDDAEKEA